MPGRAQAAPNSELPIHFQPPDSENIANYETWTAKIQDQNAQHSLRILIDAMKKGKLPTEFLRFDIIHSENQSKYILEPLFFDTKYAAEYTSDEDINCNVGAGPIGRTNNSMIIYNSSGTGGTKIKCGAGNQLYFLGDGTDVIDEGWGDDIFATGRGNDEIRKSWGREILILEKGWGTEKIKVNCGDSRPNKNSKIFTNTLTNMAAREELIDYKPPFDYINYIVFGPGIREKDIYWDNARLINRTTGDEIRFQGRCFNFIYADE
jgi:hypothetical protein